MLAQQLLTFAKRRRTRQGTGFVGRTSSPKLDLLPAGAQRLRCTFNFSDNLWAIEADPGQISQVIQNLVINAIQAMPTGGTIQVQGENLVVQAKSDLPLEAGKYVKISIQDQGVGIPADHLARIFDPYFTTKQTGSGLGLATTHSIVDSHHGHIAVESLWGGERPFTYTFRLWVRKIADCKGSQKRYWSDRVRYW